MSSTLSPIMLPTLLYQYLSVDAATALKAPPPVNYRGAVTAARFTEANRESSAMQHGCGIYDLGYRARTSVTGSDRVRWLNGMVTNNVRDLAPGRGLYAFLLSPQGRILGDMHIFSQEESLIVETDRSQVAKIAATFDHYIIMDDVEVKDIGEGETALGLAGPKSRAMLNAVGIQFPELLPLQASHARCDCNCDCVQCTVTRGEEGMGETYAVWLAPKDVYKTWQALLAAGATPVGSEALELQRIISGIPLYGADIRERDLPQETGQSRALNFIKGCYVGQEIVERIRSRGNVHRNFSGFVADGASRIAVGEKIVAGDKEVGEITSVSSLRTPSGERTLALGYIRREAGLPGREVQIGASRATVTSFPLLAEMAVNDSVMQNV